MQKTILITGSTDGIGLEAAKAFLSKGHHVLLHGRNKTKLKETEENLAKLSDTARIECYIADFSCINDVNVFSKKIIENHDKIDVLINNAGVFKTPKPITQDGLDVRFVVNTITPYLLTKNLLPLIKNNGRVINLSSAAQASVNTEMLTGKIKISDDMDAYAQSKLALTMWSRAISLSHKESGPIVIAVNPGSLLATKMVKEGFGTTGKDVHIGSDILVRLAIEDDFNTASGFYYDNDVGGFSSPHSDALDAKKCETVVHSIETVLADSR